GDTYNSVTKTGGTKITNVARGEDDSDAVNMSQLNETNENVTNLGDTINNFAGDTSTTYIEQYGRGIRYARTNDTGMPQSDAFATGQASTAVGYAARSIGAGSLALGAGAKANNEADVALGALSTTDVAVATTGTTIAGKEYAFAGGEPVATVSVGNGELKRTITNVAAGRLSADSTDAVNGSQLFATNQAIDTLSSNITNVFDNGTKYFHVKSTKADSVASGEDSIAVGPNAKASGNGSVAMGNGAEATGTGSSAMGQAAKAEGASSVAMGDGAQATKEKSTAIGSGAKATAKNAVALGADSVADRENSVSVGSAGKERQITNVKAGEKDTDAVNVAQLNGLKGSVTNIGGDVTNIQNGTDGMFQVNNTSKQPKPRATGTDAVAGGAGSTASGKNSMAIGTKANAAGENSVAMGNGSNAKAKDSVALGANSVADRANTVSVGSAGAERQITNVMAGKEDTDAVNVAQLNKSMGDVTNIANNYTDQRYNSLKRDLAEQDDTLSAGIAGAMAMASLPQPYTPGASMAAAGLGTYRGQGAVSVGVSRISDNGKWVTKLQGSTTTQGDFGVSVGVGYQW
ncbi:YadA family autotransporter adhesin, partial [Pseudomonas schmalbachii]